MANAIFPMTRAPLYWAAWILFLVSLGGFGIHVLGAVVAWSRALPGSGAALDFLRVVILTLAIYSNIVFLFAPSLRNSKNVTTACKAFLIATVVVNGSVAFFFPDFARLPTYWLWLASFVAMTVAFIAFPDSATISNKKSVPAANADTGDVPPIIWVWLGMTAFWLALTGIHHAQTANTTSAAAPRTVALTSYFNDQANVIAIDRAAQIGNALSTFENETSNQIVVAIYPRAPQDPIEQFTIETAERSRLGRKGLDNGAILFVFMTEHIARLEIGYGLEAVITDADAHRILETQLVPAFAKGDYGEGIDAILAAMRKDVRDTYQRGQMPGKLTVLWLQLKVKVPKLIDQAWPALNALELDARIGITLFGGLLGMGIWDGLRQAGRLLRNIVRGVGNVAVGRVFTAGMEGVGLDSIIDTLKVFGLVLAIIIGAAGMVIVAAGGTFGGAGAQVRW